MDNHCNIWWSIIVNIDKIQHIYTVKQKKIVSLLLYMIIKYIKRINIKLQILIVFIFIMLIVRKKNLGCLVL